MSRSAIEQAGVILRKGRRELGASSCTFYVRDQWWSDELRLLLMPGVQYEEPMYGFLWPEYGKRVVCAGEAELFLPDARESEEFRHPASPLLGPLIEQCKLFGDFVDREGVVSAARLIHRRKGATEAVLFVNFSHRVTFESSLRRKIRELLRSLKVLLRAIDEDLRAKDPFPVQKILQVLKPTERLAAIAAEGGGTSLDAHLKDILMGALLAFDIDPDRGQGIGTIHLYEPDSHMLRLSGFHGPLDPSVRRECARHDVTSGKGIISWVALRRQALHIPDLSRSPFRQIHIRIMEGACSELAVPMLAGQDLVGVLNVEGVKGKLKSRSPIQVRSIWYAANQAAIAHSLSRQAETARKKAEQANALLRISCEAHAGAGRQPLRGLAELACDWLGADRCGLWSCEKSTRRFEGVGTNYPEFNASDSPRDEGWSNYIRTTRQLLWFDNLRTCDDFRVLAWHQDKKAWGGLVGDAPRPGTVNPYLLRYEVRVELGLPVSMGNECLGVAWLSFIERTRQPPSPEDVDIAVGFAAEAALLLRSFQTEQDIDAAQREGMTLLLRVLRHEVLGKVMDKMVREVRQASGPQSLLRIQEEWPVLLEFVQSVVESLRWYDPRAIATPALAHVVFPKDLNLRSLVDQAIELANIVQSEPKCQNLVDADLVAYLDGKFVRVLLFNVLHNAKKFTSEEHSHEPIMISARLEKGLDGNPSVVISVDDAGVGIDRALAPRLGKELGVHRDPPGRIVSGGGFGLYLCNLITLAHGGRMLPPQPSQRGGACVQFAFPVRRKE